MPNNIPTEHENKLIEALEKRGVELKVHHWDGHKHNDISIPWAKIDIEIDRLHHYTDARQILADFDREYYSITRDDYDTIHIPNVIIDTYLDKVAGAIAQAARDNYDDINSE